MRGRFFGIALCLIGVSWFANSMYAHSKKLAEPIFLDHYIETVLEENLYLTFYYLTNLNDTSSVSHVNIDEMTGYVRNDFFDDFGFYPYPEIDPNMQSFTHYALREIQLELNSFEIEDALIDGQYTFNEIDVFFNDGKRITVPIGEVTILSDYPDTKSSLDSLSSSSSNDGSSSHQFRVEKDLSIENITMKYEDAIEGQVFIKLNSTNQSTWDPGNIPNWNEISGMDIRDIDFPYELEKDKYLSIYTQISPDFIGSIHSSMKLFGTTVSGKQFTQYIPVYTQQPYLEQKDVDAIIKKNSEGGSQ